MPYDLIVIGSGPGGYVCAIRAAQLGMNTAVVEKRATFGGTCLNIGCIPSKAMLNASELYDEASHKFADMGIKVGKPAVDLPTLLKYKQQAVDSNVKGVDYLFRKNKIATFGYGALCRGLLSGRMRPDSKFEGDDLRRSDPKFQQPRFAQYLAAVERFDCLARQRFGKPVIELAVRWTLDQGITTALWGARRPDQLQPVDEVAGWQLDAAAKTEIDRILRQTIADPVGPEFMAPPAGSIAA